IEGFVEHVLQHCAIRTGGVSSALFLHDPETNTLGMAACVLHGVPVDVVTDERVAMWRSVDAEVSPLWRVMCESPTEYYIQRPDSDTPIDWPGAPEWHKSMGHRLVLCIPVRVGATPLGFTAVCYAQPSALTDARIELARAFGQLTAAALELTRLSEHATAAALAEERQLAAIQHAASLEEVNAILRDSLRRMSARSNVDDFLGFVLEKVAAAVQASHVHLFRFDASKQTLTLHLSWLEGELRHGPSGEELPLWAAPFSVDVTPAWKLMVEDRKFFSPENTPVPAAEFAWPGAMEWLQRRNASDAAHTVLFVADEPVGSIGLTFTGGKRLKPEAQPLVQALAQQAAIALRLSELADRATTVAVAHERERSAQERLAELTEANAIMRRSVVSLADNPQLESFLGTLLVETCRVTRAKAAHLFVIQPENPALMRMLTRAANGRVHSAADSGGDPAFLWAPMDSTWCCELFTPHRPRDVKRMDVVSAPDEAMCSEAREWYRSQGYATCTVLPVFVSGAPAGVIVVFFSGEQQSSGRDKEILEVLLTQVELGLQLSRLAEAAKGEAVRAAVASERQNAAEDRAREVNEVNRALQATISTLAANPTLESFIAHVLRVVTSRLSAQSSAFWLSGEEPGAVLQIEHPEPAGISRRTTASAQWHASRLHHLEANRDLRVITDPQQFTLHDDADLEGIRSLLLIPLALSEEILGCLVVRSASRTVYEAGELELVQALANQAMLAVQLSRLAKKAEVAAVMEERNRLAREIHDILAQGLTGIVLMLEAAKSYLVTPSPDSAAEPLQSALELARESLAEARRSVNALRPASLDSGGLDAAFEQLAGRHQQLTGATVTLDLAPERPQISPEVEVNLLRIVQEALSNAARHARATHIRIELSYENGRLRLAVIDNGRGFDPVALEPAQMIGITGMRERAARAGGELSVRSQPGTGARVTAVIPVTDENAIRTISYS
ncbi:MAG TPA: GAF domain-containing sensor histidine kinase, partial [Bryobacteraceae bacterium]|nr:GAF domain-containing sensor histidine kinase [Bryobacteraceae bacterium]